MPNKRRPKTIIFFVLLIAFLGLADAFAGEAGKTAAVAKRADKTSSADTGKAVYQQYCLSCHAVDGHGNNGAYPDIVSDLFKKTKGTFEKAYGFISQKMPENAPGSLSDDQYGAVVKYVLSINGIPTEFTDIEGHWAQKEIEFLLDKNEVDGYVSGGRLFYKPQQNITRAEFIRYLVKAKQLFLSDASATDLTDITKSKDKVYIMTAVEYGIINGYPDHTFHPANGITRAEIATVLARSELLAPAAATGFSDVTADYWATPFIGAAAQAKLFNGYGDGTFKPGSPITRGEAAAVLYRLTNPE